MVKRCHGQYTIQQLQRCGQLSGAFKYRLQELLDEENITGEDSVLGGSGGEGGAEKHARLTQVSKFIEEYSEDQAFQASPPRTHKGFEEYKRDAHITRPAKLGRQLKRHSLKVDLWRNIRDNVNKHQEGAQCTQD